MLADNEGIDAVSMRNLASRLWVVPMAMYRHVANKEDPLDGMIEAVYREVDDCNGVDWRVTIRQRAISMRAALQRHPWAVGVMESSSPGPANLQYHNAGIAFPVGLWSARSWTAKAQTARTDDGNRRLRRHDRRSG